MFKEVNKKYKEYSNKLDEFDHMDVDKIHKSFEQREYIKDRVEFYYNFRKAVSKGDKKKDDTK